VSQSSDRSGSREPSGQSGLFEEIRSQCAEVARRARFVRIDDQGLATFAERLALEHWPDEDLDPAHYFAGSESQTLAFVIALDAINFGSGWFPVLRKRPGMSGYQTIASACKAHFESKGELSGEVLRGMTSEGMARLLGQDVNDPEVAQLMKLYARAWRDLGTWLASNHRDRFESVIEGADHSAERLVDSLATMPLYRDVSFYEELEVPFYKRAQITAADLSRVFSARGFGRFDDLDRLTLFADNLVPHVLRCERVLSYETSLSARIDAEALLEEGCLEEIEIRAVAVEAVERIVAALDRLRRPTTAHVLDGMLWNAGQSPAIKANPRHRTRTSYY
jgi:hypothetical protein